MSFPPAHRLENADLDIEIFVGQALRNGFSIVYYIFVLRTSRTFTENRLYLYFFRLVCTRIDRRFMKEKVSHIYIFHIRGGEEIMNF